ncbi:hypothetical protein [Pseudomonas aeruginosa]|uniref:hypothetical protein n=2 Tax=Pseudomonas aeruginosa TaxID=287 RepID=UPI0018DB1C1B|nr:hypothetical protein [Pseudomonas aeruginosa]MBU5974898.1 hypothetical protein [Pseudomonas aeruginosa]QPV55936.1 hypothetical protein IAU57_09055 [Pseudomonas aeruginosa]
MAELRFVDYLDAIERYSALTKGASDAEASAEASKIVEVMEGLYERGNRFAEMRCLAQAFMEEQSAEVTARFLIAHMRGTDCGFHADSDTHSTHIRTVIPR